MKMQKRERAWILALFAVYVFIGGLLLILMNPQPDKQSADLSQRLLHLLSRVDRHHGRLRLRPDRRLSGDALPTLSQSRADARYCGARAGTHFLL